MLRAATETLTQRKAACLFHLQVAAWAGLCRAEVTDVTLSVGPQTGPGGTLHAAPSWS